MKNTTFRKKALLSSVAMLLVAIVALGSATFAWFTQNPTVTATGLVMDASVTGGLQIYAGKAKDAGLLDWGTSTTLNAIANAETEDATDAVTDPAGITFGTPVSYNYAASGFYTTSAADEDNYAKKADAAISGGSVDYSEKIYLRTSVAGGGTVQVDKAKVTITKSNENTTDLANAVRIMLVDDEDNVLGTWSLDGTANKYLTATAVSAENYPDAVASGTAKSFDPITVSAAGTDYVTVYVWLDGEDDACKTTNVQNLKDLVSSVSVDFTLAAN